MNLHHASDVSDTTAASPFQPTEETLYRRWRAQKLAGYPDASRLQVTIADLNRVTAAEKQAINLLCDQANMCIYQAEDAGQWSAREAVLALGRQFGLHRLDQNLCADDEGLSAITVADKGRGQEYIPYTDKPINWHTDGYYNMQAQRIRAMTLHCVCPAANGGGNSLLDHEIAYILLREQNPDYISALMAPDAMTIPANVEAGQLVRPAQTGPVFAIDPHSGRLHMRYTHRTRSIQWRDDAVTQAAVIALRNILEQPSPYHIHLRLRPGQGIICNNVLHSREAFADDAPAGMVRLLYRARYYDRIDGSAVQPA